MSNVTPLAPYRAHPPQIFFSRAELGQILNVYGRMVARGLWKDYALDDDRDSVAFSIFRRASERPLYRIVKCPRLAAKQGAWALIGAQGQTLKRGHELDQLLSFFDRRKFEVVDS